MNTVTFRDFEERDVDFVFKCKNDKKLNSLTVGGFKPMSREEAVRWVHGCMGEHPTYKYWAICTNDDEQRIVGWISLSQIDKTNRSAHFHGILIGDPDYRDTSAWIESYLFIFKYAFDILMLNRLTGSSLDSQQLTIMMAQAMHFSTEGIQREAIYRDGRFHNIICTSVLRKEYQHLKEEGAYSADIVLANLLKITASTLRNKRKIQ